MEQWKEYQEVTASFFRSLGLEAQTDITLQGIRTKHDIDVIAESRHTGFNARWVVECKHWNSKVSKSHVLALREIINDTSVDRGIILAQNGSQNGAIETAALIGIQICSLEELTNKIKYEILSMRLRELFDRLIISKEEYCNIPKSIQTTCGLRTNILSPVGYSASYAIEVAEDLITKGLHNNYPYSLDKLYKETISEQILQQEVPHKINSIKELLSIIEPLIINLENKINLCRNKRKS